MRVPCGALKNENAGNSELAVSACLINALTAA